MQRFLVVTIGNTIHLQSSQIIKNARVYLFDKLGRCVLEENILKTDFMHVRTQLPAGHYKLHIIENDMEWTKSIVLDYEDILTK